MGKVLLCKCSSFHVLYDGLNSNKIHFVKFSDCLIPHLAVAVTPSLLSQQELYAWMGELLHCNRGSEGQPEIDPFGGRVWTFKEVEAEAFSFTPVFINSWLVLCSTVCQCSPGPAGIACVPFPPVGVAAVGSWPEHPIPAGSPSPAGIAGGGVREEQFLCSEDCCHLLATSRAPRNGEGELRNSSS